MKQFKKFVYLFLFAAMHFVILARPQANDAKKTIKDLLVKGKGIYTTNCSICHGPKGDGKGRAARAIVNGPKPRDFTKGLFKFGSTEKAIIQTIKKGIPNTTMPPWQGQLKEEDYIPLAKYIKSFKVKK